MATKIVIVVITVLVVLTDCRIGSAIGLFPFSGAISFSDISGSNMAAYSPSLPNIIQFYDFKSQLRTNITSAIVNSNTSSIRTHWLNTNVSYCFMLMNNNSTASSFTTVANNSIFSNNFTLFLGTYFTTWGFGPTVD